MSNNFVYRVMRNADSTEGRGPMVYVTTFETFAAANAYVMHKGSPYGYKLTAKRNIDGDEWSYDGWYCVHKDEVLQEYDIEQVKKNLAELRQIEERAAVLRALTKL
jgi:hypothetical protein